jgi:hypothetical protein
LSHLPEVLGEGRMTRPSLIRKLHRALVAYFSHVVYFKCLARRGCRLVRRWPCTRRSIASRRWLSIRFHFFTDMLKGLVLASTRRLLPLHRKIQSGPHNERAFSIVVLGRRIAHWSKSRMDQEKRRPRNPTSYKHQLSQANSDPDGHGNREQNLA